MPARSREVSAPALPAGTVTFLLTDVEGSTRLWESAGRNMPAAIARHYEILDRAIARHGGVRPVEQGEGDSVVAAFPRARDALNAALEAQLALVGERWPEGAGIRVRMALHTGDARLRDEGNYFGGAVNRCARLRAIAHGGQLLLSRATSDLVQDALPDHVDLVDLGVHRLRDLGRPEHVFAVVHPDLPAVRAPLRSLDALPNNLPVEPSSFVGRESELADVAGALASARALTLTGSGGCGKTRLALQAAADSLDGFPDGVWWVALAPLADGALVGEALAGALGVRPLPGQTSAEAVAVHLATRRALVVLDNCEHLLEACAELTEGLLRSCPDVTVLATSREPLGLAAETSWRVPSLSLPRDMAWEPAESLTGSDAVRLFVERALQVRPNFAVTGENAPVVARICQDLDGIPLAIELAAARVRMLSLEQIATGLADRFRLLTGGARTALPRHRTLRASVDWSYGLLDDPERVLLRRLCVFTGGFTLDACEEVCCGDGLDRYAILDLLTSLVDKSLVLVEEHGPTARYRLLETVRHYGLDRLLQAGETERLRDRHRDFFAALAERTEPDLLSVRQPQALELLTADTANLQAAIDWAVQTQPEVALQACYRLTFWWRYPASLSAGLTALTQALEAAPAGPSRVRAQGLWARAFLCTASGDLDTVAADAEEALAIGERLDDDWVRGRALHVLAYAVLWSDPRAAVEICERSRAFARLAGDDVVVADASQALGAAHWLQDDYEAAAREESVAFDVGSRIGNREIVAWHWLWEAITPWGDTDLRRRRALIERGLATAAEIGDPTMAGYGEAYLAFTDIVTGGPASALERLRAARARAVASGAAWCLGTIDWYIGTAQAALGRLEEARATLVEVVERECDGFAFGLAWSLGALAGVERVAGGLAAARAHAERALEVAKRVGTPVGAAIARQELGRVAAALGDWSRAEHELHDALDALSAARQLVHLPDALDGLAEVAAGLESHAESARLLAAADRAREDLGLVRWLPGAEQRLALDARLREALGAEAHDAAVSEGRALGIDEAVAFARRGRGSRKRPSGGWESLTPTELEVVRHAAAGLTNAEIGERLFISRGTVKVHLSHIFGKLGVRNRSELTAEAVRRAAADRDAAPARTS